MAVYSGEYAFVGYAYDKLDGHTKSRVNDIYWSAANHRGGQLDLLYKAMKQAGHDFGADDPFTPSSLPTDVGAEEYEEIMVLQEFIERENLNG
jgi:hypothetical protein